jgi:pantothenate kinase
MTYFGSILIAETTLLFQDGSRQKRSRPRDRNCQPVDMPLKIAAKVDRVDRRYFKRVVEPL